jgi:hypothetical protein
LRIVTLGCTTAERGETALLVAYEIANRSERPLDVLRSGLEVATTDGHRIQEENQEEVVRVSPAASLRQVAAFRVGAEAPERGFDLYAGDMRLTLRPRP